MFTAAKELIRTDSKIKWILLGGLIIQIITAITAIGTSSADQHFQIIEFSLYQLSQPNGATYVWEIENFVRPTLQVYLFSGYHLALNFIGLTDPYAQLTILRILLGVFMFVIFNLLAIHYFNNEKRNILVFVLLLVNFSWVLPYTRTLFCSEMMSSLFFFGTLLLYERKKTVHHYFLPMLLIGFLMSLAFYFRFQIGFAMAGWGVTILIQRKFKHIFPLAIGFAIGAFGNILLDYGFYKEFVLTPYTYFYANINDGRADSFGTSSFIRYIGFILLTAPAPLFSFIFFYYNLKTFIRNKFFNPIFLSVIIFVIAHSVVGHKEERFIFPVLNVLPLMIGWSVADLVSYYERAGVWIKRIFQSLMGFTIALNILLLIVLTLVPFSQTVEFSYRLKNKFNIDPVVLNGIGQLPFETPSGNPMVFYKNGAKNITQHKITIDSIGSLTENPEYITATYNDIKEQKLLLDSLGYKPVLHSSDFLWGLNEWLHKKNINTINEIWVLYQKQE